MVQSRGRSIDSKQLSARCTGVQALNYSEKEWSSPVKDRLSPKLTKNQITPYFSLMLYKQKKSAVEIAGIIGVGRATIYRYLEEMG